MDLKGYHCLADLFGKLNSQEKLEDDFTTIPEGGKLKFFWEKCGHEKIDASSIIERTKQKIRRDVMRRRRNYFLVASASVAASILICISTIHFLTHSENTNLDFQAIAEQMDSQSVEEVTLITAKEQLNLDEDAFVTYSKEGKVTVNSKVIREKEEKKVKAKNFDPDALEQFEEETGINTVCIFYKNRIAPGACRISGRNDIVVSFRFPSAGNKSVDDKVGSLVIPYGGRP